MIVIADNDLILKLCQCDLMECLPQILGESPEETFITPTARFQLLGKTKAKGVARSGNEETYERLSLFLQQTAVISPIQNVQLLAAMSQIPNIDDGEQLLFAAAAEVSGCLLLTGDKRALQALEVNADRLGEVYDAVCGKVVIFESALLLALDQLGFPLLKQKLLGNPKPDGMLRTVLRADMSKLSLTECLCSYAQPVSRFLAFSDRLPVELFTRP